MWYSIIATIITVSINIVTSKNNISGDFLFNQTIMCFLGNNLAVSMGHAFSSIVFGGTVQRNSTLPWINSSTISAAYHNVFLLGIIFNILVFSCGKTLFIDI